MAKQTTVSQAPRREFLAALGALPVAGWAEWGSGIFAADKPLPKNVFARYNLIAWCVVPFDAAHRGPVERAQMLQRLGITMLAYDWRDKDIPTFDKEVDALKEYGIKLQAFWLTFGSDPASENGVRAVLDLLKRRNVTTEIWCMYRPPAGFNDLSQDEKVAQIAEAVKYLAVEAQKLRCKVGLYDHGGWFGDPNNQIAIINKLKMDNIGVVYCFHHSFTTEEIEQFPDRLAKMKPYLYAINLNGMKAGSHEVRTIGEGDREVEMIREILKSGYHGPIGIIHEQPQLDAEIGLRRNIDGLKRVLVQIHDTAALSTY